MKFTFRYGMRQFNTSSSFQLGKIIVNILIFLRQSVLNWKIYLLQSCTLRIHPIYLTMASAVTASYAFMLPISSPPNAIIFATGELRMREMLVNGLFLNIVCNMVLYFFILTYGEFIFKFSEFERYADQIYKTNCSSYSSPYVV